MSRNKYPEETLQLILAVSRALFTEKGYDNTSLQDIISRLGGLSKGAIYHHFKSKEEIFEAVYAQISAENTSYYNAIRDDETQNGFQKLQTLLRPSRTKQSANVVVTLTENIVNDPRFLQNELVNVYMQVAPLYIEPILRQGIGDGSIKTQHPKELAEVLATLLNIWINPVIVRTTPDEMRAKLIFFDTLLRGIGLAILDEELVAQYVALC